MSGNAQEPMLPMSEGMAPSNEQLAMMMMNDVHQQDSDQQECKDPMANNQQLLMDLSGLQDKLARVSHSQDSPTAVMGHEAANADVYNQDVEAKTQICFDFTKGMCTRGDKCKYSHDIATIVHFNSKEKGICFDYLRNQCHRGLLCRFSHDLSNIAQQCQVYNGAGTRNRTNAICYDFVKGVCQRGTECRYSHDLTLIARTARSNSTGRSTEVCYDYLRGRCSRGAACKYSHSISLLGAPGLLGAALQAQNLQAMGAGGMGMGNMPMLSGSYPGSPVYSPMSSLAAHAARMPLSPMGPPSNLQHGTPTYGGLGTPTAMAAASPSGMMFRKHLAGAAQDALAMLTASPGSPGMMTPTSVDGVNLAGVDYATLNNAAAAVAAAAAAASNSPHAQQLMLDQSTANLNSAEAALAQLRLAPSSEASSMPSLQASQAPEMLLPAVSGHDNVMLGTSSPGPHMNYGHGSSEPAPSPLSRQSSNAASMAAKLDIPISLPAIKTQAPLHLQMAAAMNSPDMRAKFQMAAESHLPPSRLGTMADPGSAMGKDAYQMAGADMSGMFGAFPTSMPLPRYV